MADVVRADAPVLVQFAKSAVPGTVKTRLVPPLTVEQAAQLHANMVVHTLTTLCQSGLGEVQLWLSGLRQESLLQRCEAVGSFQLRQQCSGNLGTKMAHAVQATLSQSGRIILVGSDAPGIDAAYLRAALKALNTVDVVLGPAGDGGYVLLGLKRCDPRLFTAVAWGSDSVLEETLRRVQALGWSCHLLGEMPDIDRAEDLPLLPEFLAPHTADAAQAEMLAS